MARPLSDKKRIKQLEAALKNAVGSLLSAFAAFGENLDRYEAETEIENMRDIAAVLPVPEDKYTAKEREDAALICDMIAAAYAQVHVDGNDYPTELDAAKAIGANASSRYLAERAQAVVIDQENEHSDEPYLFSAEAAAWIRSGWSPGDEWSILDEIGPETEIPDPVPGLPLAERGYLTVADLAPGIDAQPSPLDGESEPTDAELVEEIDRTGAGDVALENAALAEVAAGDEEPVADPDALDADVVSLDDVAEADLGGSD